MSLLKSLLHDLSEHGALLVAAVQSPAITESIKRLIEVGMIATVSSIIGTYAMTQRLEERIDGYAKIRAEQIAALQWRILACESSIREHLGEDLKERDRLSRLEEKCEGVKK